MRTASALALAAALTAALPPPGAAAQDAALRYKLKEGDTFYAKNVTDNDMAMEFMGNKVPVKMKMTMVQKFAVKSAQAGATTVEMTITDASMDAPGLPGGGLGQIGEMFKGVTLTATLDENFDVTKVEGQDKLVDKLAKGDPAMKQMVQGMMGDAAVKQWFVVVFPPLPGKPVAAGGSWTRTDKMPFSGIGDMTVNKKLTLQGVTGGVATVKETATITFKPSAGGAGGLPFKITKADLKTKDYTSTHQIDVAAGRLKESKTTMTMTGAMTMSAQGQEIEMQMDVKTTSTVTVTDRNPVKD